MKHYLIFMGGGGGHSVVYLLKASDPLAALCRFIENEDDVLCGEDGTVIDHNGRKALSYPHPIAYIESTRKSLYEWQMSELPERAWEVDYAGGLFCGEDETVFTYIEGCRKYLRREYPRSRAEAFVWYLRDDQNHPQPLVTFFRKRSRAPIQILRRYLITDWKTPGEPIVEEWTGSYEDLLNSLWLKWWSSEEQIEHYLQAINAKSEAALEKTVT